MAMEHPRLALELLRMFAAGEISGAQLQRVAAAAWADGWCRGCRLAEKLATAGGSGAFSGNVQRDVFSAAKRANLMGSRAEPYVFEAPGADGKLVTLQMFLPHEQLGHAVRMAGGIQNVCFTEEDC